MNIVAFMQNPWFKPGTPQWWVDQYREDQVFHRKILARSMSGARLRKAFGDELFGRIHWDNVNWRPSDFSAGMLPPDMDHIRNVYDRVNPSLVICFGRVAFAALQEFDPPCPVWGCHHPNARHKTFLDLEAFAKMVADYEKEHDKHTVRTTGNGQNA